MYTRKALKLKPQQNHQPTTKAIPHKDHHSLPSTDHTLLHDPPQFSFREHRVLQVQPAVLVDVRFSYLVLCTKPGVLGVTIVVLGRTKGVGHALKAVHDWTGKVVGGVNPAEKC